MTRPRPSIGAFFTNWRSSDLPVPQRLAVALRNNLTKLRTMKDCCGHPGQPGC